MKFKGIIFDLDGTLIDSVADICLFSNKVLAKYGYPTHPLSCYIDWIGDGARKLIERAVPAGLDSNTFDTLYSEYLEVYELEEHTESVLYDGISDLLDKLNADGTPIAILTNKPHKVMLKTVECYFTKWNFVALEGQQDSKPRKPDPSVALEIAQLMQLKPEDIAFVGDSAVDVNTGNSAGMTSICVTAGYETLQNIIDAKPDIMLDTHKELLSIL